MVSFKGYTLLLKAAGRAWVEQPGGASLSKLVCCSFGPDRRDRGSICSPKSFCPMLNLSQVHYSTFFSFLSSLSAPALHPPNPVASPYFHF